MAKSCQGVCAVVIPGHACWVCIWDGLVALEVLWFIFKRWVLGGGVGYADMRGRVCFVWFNGDGGRKMT
jgi:hypothetical protein